MSDLILDGLPADFSLFLGALVVGAGAGIAGGVLCARRPRSVRARLLGMAATFALCAPVYWVALVSILLFGSGVGRLAELPILDTGNYRPLSEDPVAWLESLLVPWMVAGAPLAAICLRMTAATVRDLGEEDFIRMVVVGNLAADLLIGRLDPRVRAQ